MTTVFVILTTFSILSWILALIDLFFRSFKNPHHRTLSLFMILFIPVGPVLYFLLRKGSIGKKRIFDPFKSKKAMSSQLSG